MRNLVAVIVVILITILGVLSLAGCTSQTQVETTTFDASAEETSGPILAGEGSGTEVRVIFISWRQQNLLLSGNYDLMESKIRAELERIVNGGEYDIITVRTIYDSGYLISAEVWYCVQQE